jgi:integrase
VDPVVAAHLEWLRLRGRAVNTIETRRRVLARTTWLIDRPLTEASAEDLLAWRAGLRFSPRTIANYVSHVSQFYVWAAAQGLVPANPAAGLPVPPRARLLPRPIDEEELMAVLPAAPGRIRIWLVLAGWAGLRAVEIAGLRRENVSERGPAPVILVAWNTTKGPDERLVPMSAFVREELVPVLPRRGWLFPHHSGVGPVRPHVVSHQCNRFLHGCGCGATLHQLRHRFATQTYRYRRDLRVVQDLMGHRDPATTAGYAAYSEPAAAAAVASIPVPRSAPRGQPGFGPPVMAST